MDSELAVSGVAHVIQLAVAPVFLIAGIAGMLGVLTNRLARIVERARRQEDRLSEAGEALNARLRQDLNVLLRRARLSHWAIGSCTICALLICLVVVVLFLGASLDLNVSAPIAALFITAMAAFITGLLCFLREIQLAISNLRIGPQ
jgi:hypothetical protein